jgi:hypothetical protein
VQRQLARAVELDQQLGASNWYCQMHHYWNCIADQSRRSVILDGNPTKPGGSP